MPPNRATRSKPSRTSSPMVHPPTDSPTTSSSSLPPQKEKNQQTLNGWLEPPPQAPTASFEEHGFGRQGVVSNMQPLGTLPSSRDRARARAEGPRRSMLGKNGITGEDAGEPSDSPMDVEDVRRSESQNLEDVLPQIPVNKAEEEDEDYMPKAKKQTSRAAATVTRKSATPAAIQAVVEKAAEVAQNGMINGPTKPHNEVALDRILYHAIKIGDAQDKRLADALRWLEEEARHDEELRLLVRVILGREGRKASPAEWKSFERKVKDAKKIVDKRKRAADETDEHRSKRTRTSRSATDVDPIEQTPAPSNHNSINNNSEAPPPTSIENSVSDTKLKPSHPASPPEPVQHSSLQTESPGAGHRILPERFSDHKTTFANCPPASALHLDSSAPSSPMVRSNSNSSSSDLSSVDDNIADGPPPPELNGHSVAQPTAHPRQRLLLTMPKAKSSKAGSKKAAKKSSAQAVAKTPPQTTPLREIDESESEEVKQRRQQYQQGLSNVDRFNSEITDSSVRNAPVAAASASGPGALNGTDVAGDAVASLSAIGNPAKKPPALGRGRVQTPSLGEQPATKGQSTVNTRPGRTKTSPIKNKTGGGVAGVVPPGGGSPIGRDDNGAENRPGLDNDDFCRACGFTGYLLCCDGCNDAFHLTCADPPLRETPPPNEQWLCHSCLAKKRDSEQQNSDHKLFSGLFDRLNKRNTTVFALPKPVQEHFEDVRADREGGFSEITQYRPMPKGRSGWPEAPNYTALTDNKGNAILCCHCGKSALGERQLLRCDYCPVYWHLDCLDPPMSNPPPLPASGTTRQAWQCPRHVDRVIRDIPLFPGATSTHHLRKAKNPTIIDPALTRGVTNYGVIQVDDSDGDDNQFYDDKNNDGEVVQRLPSMGIKLDFISKVKTARMAEAKKNAAKTRKVINRDLSRPIPAFDKFSLASASDRRASVNLVQLANREADLGLNGDGVQTLLYGLNAESPDDVVRTMNEDETAAASAPPSEEEKRCLLALQELIRRRLGENGSSA
ncbi:hypothetical protein K490DRAFT_55999 [Saccharata proteae CBS 121410]|uniref:PHD-type domain-containing protein n=1 Tax=Saccharata proteae CBS 121410 TaxID=1314787 RepID=A0A9P4HV35_9PEZI|nr:hypothetical protein K490DRAFT_55999 [Saccharata proteae CBS 121410]